MSFRRRWQLGLFLSVMLLGAAAELISIGAIIPFLTVISNPAKILKINAFQEIFTAIGINSPTKLIIAVAAVFALGAVLAATVRLCLLYVTQRFVYGISQDLAGAIFGTVLHQPYAYHLENNSVEAQSAIGKAQSVTTQILLPLSQAASTSVIAFVILCGLIYIAPLEAIGSGVSFALIYVIVMRRTRATILESGRIISRAQGDRYKAINEGIGGIRDVILDKSQNVFVSRFAAIESQLRAAQSWANYVAQAPKFLLEALSLVIVATMATLFSIRDGGLTSALPVFGTLALGAQRLLPLMQQGYSAWVSTLTAGAMLTEVLDILRLPHAEQYSKISVRETLSFQHAIEFSNVSLTYPKGTRPAVEEINFKFPKGARIGLAGRSGSGKSTLMDMMLGLLPPDHGRILVDGVELTGENRSAWQTKVAHVPQAIFLSDTSLAENIAFGVPHELIDFERVETVAAQAELSEVIKGLPDGLNSLVGERGIRLSGGQRQRIGIARALYKKAEVLVLDEATSALDTETETAVMKSIGKLGPEITVLIIAHRLSTLEGCDMVVTLETGHIKSVEIN